MSKSKTSAKKQANPGVSDSSVSVDIPQLLQMAQIRAEKCELKEARESYSEALEEAKKISDLRSMMEALSGLFRLAGEALDVDGAKQLEKELDSMMTRYPKQVPPMAWYCKGVVARQGNDPRLAQRHLHRYLRTVRRGISERSGKKIAEGSRSDQEALVRGWVMLAITFGQYDHPRRAEFVAELLLGKFADQNFRSVNGMLNLLLGTIYEGRRDYERAREWFQKAHASFMGEHSWFYHLYVLYAYARLARHQRNYAQAYWYLDLIEKAVVRPEFGMLRKEIALERSRLEQDAVDLLIDSRQCVVKTRDGGQISLRKQYVLLHILEALSEAHRLSDADRERGLSKAEIIQHVWQENYRPEAHDNKLYYNINRLRKLIEPDVHKPRYLLNWKEGYRLAPGLRIHYVGSASGSKTNAKLSKVGEAVK